MDENITLYSLEGVLIPIRKSVGAGSNYIKGMIDDNADHVPLPGISEKLFAESLLILSTLMKETLLQRLKDL